MSRARPAVALAALAFLTGCSGVTMPDVLELRRDGSLPGARLDIVVNDGGFVRCDNGPERKLSSSLLLSARGVRDDAEKDATASKRFPRRPGSLLSYVLRTEQGTVTWSDTSRPLPSQYFRAALLVRQIAQQVCGRAR